ncbi:MAG: GGDEF domain-containing protein [Magnetovibrio sp.]|nr:GGDEF domain-containing protein [Magnetovibrio sp.]
MGHDRAIKSQKSSASNLARIIEESNNSTFQAIDIILTNVAVSMRPDPMVKVQDTKKYLQLLLSEAPQVREIAFADASGHITAISRENVSSKLNISGETYFRHAVKRSMSELYISHPKPGRLLLDAPRQDVPSKQWHFIVFRPVHDSSGNFVGAALAVINPGFFQEQIRALDVGHQGSIAYYRYDGSLLVKEGVNSVLVEKANLDQKDLFSIHLPRREWGTYIKRVKGRDKIISYRATSRWPLLVVVSLDQDEQLASWYQESQDLSYLMSGSLFLLLVLSINIFRQRSVQERVEQELLDAHHDPLTKLPSLRLLLDRLSNALRQAHRENDNLSVLYIDLDGFKPVNDKYGHDAGDYVLKIIAERFKKCIRETDTVARIGGDEFVIILTKTNNINAIDKIAHMIIQTTNAPIFWKEHELCMGASIGIAHFPEHGTQTETLIKVADDAMYEAKRRGKNQFVISPATLESKAEKKA